MADTCDDPIKKIEKLLEDCDENPDVFIEPQLITAKKFITFAKSLYDKSSLKFHHGEQTKTKSLSKLLTKGFDEQQIWQQIELRNEDIISIVNLPQLSKLASDSNSNKAKKTTVTAADSDSEISDRNEGGYVFDDDDESEADMHPRPDLSDSNKLEELDTRSSNTSTKVSRKRVGSSVVDDKFFSLSMMEQFLKLEDLKEEKGGILSNEDSEDDVDLFEDIPSEDDFEDMDMDSEGEDGDDMIQSATNGKVSKEIMYDDFFDPPDIEDDGTSEVHDAEGKMTNLQNREYDTRDFENPDDWNEEDRKKSETALSDSDEDKDEELTRPKTAFEKQQEKERKRIFEMEESLLKPKPWQLTGEVAASGRPEDSLVHQPTTFDSNVRRDIITTDELTARIEELVRMAIVNKAWSDVERKVKPKDEPVSLFKKPLVLEQTKSKKGLAELYEEDYLKLKTKTNEDKEEDPRHAEINKLMDQLLPELNALFAHIPKPPVPEIRVVSNLPAVTLEDVAPVALSDATLLAPEEIKRRMSGEIKGKTERSGTDKKRERRKKKAHQKLKQKKVDEKMRELSAISPAIAKKHEKLVAIKKLKQSKNARVVTGNESGKVKSSKDFFSRLDDLTHSKFGLKAKKSGTKKPSEKSKK